jgi:hypothetical protein
MPGKRPSLRTHGELTAFHEPIACESAIFNGMLCFASSLEAAAGEQTQRQAVAMAAVSASVGQADSGLRAAVQAASTTTLRRVLTEYECCPIANTAGDDAAAAMFLALANTTLLCGLYPVGAL